MFGLLPYMEINRSSIGAIVGPVPFCTCARAAVIAHYAGQAVRGVAVCGGVAHVSYLGAANIIITC